MPALGIDASLQGARPFPDDNRWNKPIDSDPVDPDSDLLIDSIGRTATLPPDFGALWNGGPFGIPYVVVSGDTPKVPVSFRYADKSYPGPYPIPPKMILADQGGNRFLKGAPDSRWNDDELDTLKGLTGDDFEVVTMGPLITQ